MANSIGQFIAALRKANGMTQQDVADRLNVSNKSVSRWERDECAPDLSLIPALAEMFGITCDELLKGERILNLPLPEKKEPRVEKQIKSLVNRTLSGFKTLAGISFAICAVGLVCMFGISYGFYRPVIGFAVMLLFEVCALVIAVLAVSRTRDVKDNNELFEIADEALIAKFNNTLGTISFVAFWAILAAVLLSLPLILYTSDYVYSVVPIYSYFTVFFGGIVLILMLIFIKCKNPYIDWITENKRPEKVRSPLSQKVQKMTVVQVGLTLAAGLIFVFVPYLDKPTDSYLFDAVALMGLCCLAASIIYFVIVSVRNRKSFKEFALRGIRNILLIPSTLIVSNMHVTGWTHLATEEEGRSADTLTRYDSWYTEYFWYAVALAVIVFVLFSLIEALLNRKLKKQ